MEVLSFYLPQFHPIPENDEWWGKGFTEWRNVVQAQPRFTGHWQPHLPADLGFVDLRCRESLYEQTSLAAQFGVTGFVMYHYWFRGRRLLERPVESILADPDWPGRFCVCWANESWSKIWDGRESEVLMRQEYADDDDTLHAAELARIMGDPRYIRIEGRPLLLIYRPGSHPALERFRDRVTGRVRKHAGAEPLIFGVKSGFDEEVPVWAGAVHGVVSFQPNRRHFALADQSSRAVERLRRALPDTVYQWLKRTGSSVKRVDYKGTVDRVVAAWRALASFEYPCVFPNWDNTARRRTPIVIQCDDPREFGRFVREAVSYLREQGRDGPLFVNAWNEWAEGCHLEPDLKNGRAYLTELASALPGATRPA